MIEPMKRLSLVLLTSEKDKVLDGLRSLGVVHLDLKSARTSEQETVLSELRRYQDALALLEKPKRATKIPADKALAEKEAEEACARVLALKDELRHTVETLMHWKKRVEYWSSWGDFEPGDVRDLASKGYFLNIYTVPAARASEIATIPDCIVLQTTKYEVRFAVLSRSEETLEAFSHISWPEFGPKQKAELLAQNEKHLAHLKQEIENYSAAYALLEAKMKDLEATLAWEDARAGVGEHDGLAYLTGYIPASHGADVLAYAREHGVAVQLTDPQIEESVPTKLKNSFFPQLMKPVFDLLGIIPGYNERDISWPFFLFFSIFFGMILGDGAYGLIVVALGAPFLIKQLVAKKRAEGPLLLVWLGVMTALWGALSGSWLATPYASLPPFLQSLVIPLFNPSLLGDAAVSNNITIFCFTLGALQLGIASVWNFFRTVFVDFAKSIGHLGWIGLTVGLYLLSVSVVANVRLLDSFFPEPLLSWFFQMGNAGATLQSWVVPCIISSYIVVLLFSYMEGPFFRSLLRGASNFLPTSLNAISAFADNISYIRLFAVGLAGYYIEVSFASMVKGFGMDSFGGIVATVLVLVFGHTLNLLMGFLSVVVHGIRLNVLEFSNRLGMEWSGRSYEPFKLKD